MRLSQSLYHFQCIFCLFVVYRGLLQLSRANCSPHLRIFVLLLYHDRSLTPRWRNSRSLVLLEPNKNPSIHFSRFQPTYATKFTCTQADLGRTTWSWFMTSTFSTLWPINKQLSDGGIQRRFHGQKEKKTWRAYSLPSKPQSQGPMAEFVSRRDHSRMLVVMWCWAPYQSCLYIR